MKGPGQNPERHLEGCQGWKGPQQRERFIFLILKTIKLLAVFRYDTLLLNYYHLTNSVR